MTSLVKPSFKEELISTVKLDFLLKLILYNSRVESVVVLSSELLMTVVSIIIFLNMQLLLC